VVVVVVVVMESVVMEAVVVVAVVVKSCSMCGHAPLWELRSGPGELEPDIHSTAYTLRNLIHNRNNNI
jgi:hypothetical protein